MTELDLTHLRAVAEAATPGPWRSVQGDLEGKPPSEYVRTLLANREQDGTTSGELHLLLAPNDIDPELGSEVVPALTGDGPRARVNAAHIATFDPPTVLALIDRAEKAEAEAKRRRGDHDGGWFWSQSEWADWSNRLAQMLPDEYEDDAAQEAIIERALGALIRRPDELTRLREGMEALAFMSDDGTEYEHNEGCQGEAECPACWAKSIRAVLAGGEGQ